MVVVKGEMKAVVAPRAGLVLRTCGVNVLLLVGVLMVVVVVALSVTAAGGCVVVVVDCVVPAVTLRDGVVVVAFLVPAVEASAVALSFTEAVVVSSCGVRGGT